MVAYREWLVSRSVMERRPSLERFSQQRVGWLLVGVVSIVWFGWAGRAGLGNPYYSASARTLASNPQWLLSGAFDPGGYVTVDKPPVGVWASAFGVAVTGASAIGFILPNAVLAWLAAWFTSRAVPRLSAPFVMLLVLLTPGMTVLARSSLPDATMLAAGCASAAVLLGSSRARGPAFAGALFGVAVLAKPGAVLILPAFFVLLTMRRLGGFRRGAAFFGVFLLVLGAWLVGASVTPDRPYFGGTTQDSAIELLVGADTKGRVVDADLVASGDRFVGLASAGEPGVTRTVSGRMGRQAGFLAVFALLGGLGLLRDSSAEVDRSVVAFWLTWLVVHLVVYSMLPGIAHAYYAASLGPPIAVLSVLVIREGGAGFLSALGLAASAYITFGLVQGSAVLQPWVALGLFVVGAVLAVGWAVWANSSQVAVGIQAAGTRSRGGLPLGRRDLPGRPAARLPTLPTRTERCDQLPSG